MALVLLLVGLLAPLGAQGARPSLRTIGSAEGLLPGEVHALAQGPDGRIWIGGAEGLWTWDGRRARRQDGGEIRRLIKDIEVLDTHTAWVRLRTGEVLSVGPQGVHTIHGPDGQPLIAAGLTQDAAGRPVVLHRGRIDRYRDGFWEALVQDRDLWRAWVFEAVGTDRFLVSAARSWWLVDVRGSKERIWVSPDYGFRADVSVSDGRMILGDRSGSHRLTDLQGRRLDGWIWTRPWGLALGQGTVWMSSGRGVYWRHADGARGRWSDTQGFRGGGDLIVDREGNLWVGRFSGLAEVPSPDILHWDHREGLSSHLYRYVVPVDGGVVVTSWGSLEAIHGQDWRAELLSSEDQGGFVASQVCRDGEGGVWASRSGDDTTRGLVRVGPSGDLERVPARVVYSSFEACSPDGAGGVWITSQDGLHHVGGDVEPARAPLPRLPRTYRALHVDPDGLAWVGAGPRICHARLTPRQEPTDPVPDWQCESLPAGTLVRRLLRTPQGWLWASTHHRGVWVRTERGWRPLPGLHDRPSGRLRGLAPAREQGIWIGGLGTLQRVLPDPDDPLEYTVLEDLTDWVGPLVGSINDLAEDPDGALWLAHTAGIARVPPSARHAQLDPPVVTLREVLIDGVPATAPLHFPAADSTARLAYLAPSFRAPDLLRFRTRVDQQPWSPPAEDATFDLRSVPPGRHTFHVSATLDGRTWSAPHRVRLVVPRPLYARLELWLAVLVALALLAIAVVRVRLGLALREERLRTRIALDLHDEVGAGLASIGMLGDLTRRELPEDARRSISDDIVSTTDELSDSLRGIVWSLQPRSSTLEALGWYLADRARNILPELALSGAIDVHIDAGASDVRLPLETLRAAQLIGVEALHNVAKHARADRVGLTVERRQGRWCIEVADDGRGLHDSGPTAVGHGLGLRGMRERAREIGADVVIASREPSGTRVELRLPHARRWGWGSGWGRAG